MSVTAEKSQAEAGNIVAFPKPQRAPARVIVKGRFSVKEFENASGSKSWRVEGYKLSGERVRINYVDETKARAKQIDLETEFIKGKPSAPTIQATHLSETQVKIAETCYLRLGDTDPGELLRAVEHWLVHGRNKLVESPRMDDAFKDFEKWTLALPRRRTGTNLRTRLNTFVNSIPNIRVSEITPEIVEDFLDKRSVSSATKDNDRRAVSRFFTWAMDRKRRWATVNPCRAVKVTPDEKGEIKVLTVDECETILKAAQQHREGRLLPYVVACLFCAIRPEEAQKLTWDLVNLQDAEIRIPAAISKVKRSRVVRLSETMVAWLRECEGKPFYPANWRKDFDLIKAAAGFGNPERLPKHVAAKFTNWRTWPDDVLRHTGISHYFRNSGSYGLTAEWAGNSEQIIKNHYQGKVSSEETKRFYALAPKKGRRK